MSTIFQQLQSVAGTPDTAAPGLTKYIPQSPQDSVDKNPLGEYVPPPVIDNGDFSFMEIAITTSPVLLHFNAHEHIMIENQGTVTIQVSVDGALWIDWLPAGRVAVCDYHKGNQLYFQCPVGTAVLIVTTW